MSTKPAQISVMARQAVKNRDWGTVSAGATEILRRNPNDPEGHFLAGLVEKASGRPRRALLAFAKSLELDATRHDAAIELANQYLVARRYGEACELLGQYEPRLNDSPRYLDMAGTAYSTIGLNERAWPLYQRAVELQPEIDLFQANLAACGVFLGRIEQAREIYQALLEKHPNHQRNHYHLARLAKARDHEHIEQMQQVLLSTNLPPARNVFLLSALGKEFEDLEQWKEAFHYYQQAADAVASVANYNVGDDIAVIDQIAASCTVDWLADRGDTLASESLNRRQPIFIVGLPRTGTTLTERIVSSHSQVASIGETEFVEHALRQHSGVQTTDRMNPAIVRAVTEQAAPPLASTYLSSVEYLLDSEPMFIDKLPYNFLYLGFIAKAFPQAKIIHLRRHPLDACFAMYKQMFTWAYKFSYRLEDLSEYYVAYDRLMTHWRTLLGERLIELSYEELVTDQEAQTRRLLERLGLPFEAACLAFEQNKSASATASSVQVREKAHTRSVARWRHFADQLAPLSEQLAAAGIELESA